MQYVENPFTPFSGATPEVVVSSEGQMNRLFNYFYTDATNHTQRPLIIYGAEKSGKTVALNYLENLAYTESYLLAHIEATNDKVFFEAVKNALAKLSLKLSDESATTEESDDFAFYPYAVRENIANSNTVYGDDLTYSFVELGKSAAASETTVCIFVDDMHNLSKNGFQELLPALHRCTQLNLPIAFVGTGLPSIKKKLADAVSYSERLFIFEELLPLNRQETQIALSTQLPDGYGIVYDDSAMDAIMEETKGQPFLIQALAHAIFEIAKPNEKLQIITDSDVEIAIRDPDYLQLTFSERNKKDLID